MQATAVNPDTIKISGILIPYGLLYGVFTEIPYDQEIILRLFLKAWFREGFETAFGRVALRAELHGLKFPKILEKGWLVQVNTIPH